MAKHWTTGSPYAPNIYAKTRLVDIKVQLGGCQWPGCTVTAPALLEYAHLEETPLLKKTRERNHRLKKNWGSRNRGRKERLQDIRQWPGSYTLFCGDKGEDHHSFWDHEDEHDFKPKSLLQLALERAYTYLLPRHTVIQVVG